MAEILFSFDVCLSVRVSVSAQRNGQSDQFLTVKVTEFKLNMHVPRDTPDITP